MEREQLGELMTYLLRGSSQIPGYLELKWLLALTYEMSLNIIDVSLNFLWFWANYLKYQ